MNLLYQKKETETEIIYTFKYYWLMFLIFFVGVILTTQDSYRSIGYILMVLFIAAFIPIRIIFSKAMKRGCHIKGSKFSIKNPIELRIKK